jgi:hypothetical protein
MMRGSTPFASASSSACWRLRRVGATMRTSDSSHSAHSADG